MSVQNFIPTIWGELINKELRKQAVYLACTNSNYQGQISKQGDKVKINELGPITVDNYTRNSTTISYQELEDASQMLEITESKYFAFAIDDADKAQSSAELLKPAIDSAVYSIKDTIDVFISGMANEAGITTGLGTTGTPIEINSSNVNTYLVKMARKLDDNSVPRDNRFCVIPGFFLEDLILADIVKSTDNVQTLENGFITKYAGFNLLLSNNVPNTSSAKYQIIAGHPMACTFASQAGDIEANRLESKFCDGVRGLYMYGKKVVRPEALCCLFANEAAEA